MINKNKIINTSFYSKYATITFYEKDNCHWW